MLTTGADAALSGHPREACAWMRNPRPEPGLLARAPCPNRGGGGIPPAKIASIYTRFIAIMSRGGYARFRSGRLGWIY
jgi:hypothetical protein